MTSRSNQEIGDGVDRFLQNRAKSAGGAPCIVCKHPHRHEIEQAAIRFNDQRKLWGQVEKDPETEEITLLGTDLPWNRFVKEHLKPRYGYNGADDRALKRHMENHCNVEIK